MSAQFKPLQNICEFLHAFHVYADEARHNVTRYVEATHFCAHARADLRQCLIYDSPEANARLIGVEYMIPREVYEQLPAAEQVLWHSHDFEVRSGLLVLPRPDGVDGAEWQRAETEAMKEIVGLYGKTWHFWQVDRGDELPLGAPVLMGSLTQPGQLDLEAVLKSRNERFGVHHADKANVRQAALAPETDIHPLADSWWEKTS